MASPSVTYQFISGTLIDNDAHNQNNQDLINAITNGVLDITGARLTANTLTGLDGGTIGQSASNTFELNGTILNDLKPESTSYTFGTSVNPVRAVYLSSSAYLSSAGYLEESGSELLSSLSFNLENKSITDVDQLHSLDIGACNFQSTSKGMVRVYSFVSTVYTSSSYYLGSSSSTIKSGINAKSAGSLAFIAITVKTTSTSGTATTYIRKNGTDIVSAGALTFTAANVYKSYTTYTRGAYTFSENDNLGIFVSHTGTVGINYWQVMLGVYLDA